MFYRYSLLEKPFLNRLVVLNDIFDRNFYSLFIQNVELRSMVAQKFIHVREVKPEDLFSVYKIAQISFKDPYPLKLLRHIYETNPDGFLVAEVDKKVVGYLIGVVRWGNIGHILAIAVDESFRRNGIGSALMLNAFKRLRENGAGQVELEARVSNEEAQNFYSKLGFEAKEIIPSYYSDGESAVSMVYEL